MLDSTRFNRCASSSWHVGGGMLEATDASSCSRRQNLEPRRGLVCMLLPSNVEFAVGFRGVRAATMGTEMLNAVKLRIYDFHKGLDVRIDSIGVWGHMCWALCRCYSEGCGSAAEHYQRTLRMNSSTKDRLSSRCTLGRVLPDQR